MRRRIKGTGLDETRVSSEQGAAADAPKGLMLEVDRAGLLKLASRAARTAERPRSSILALSKVLLTADGALLRARTTDLYRDFSAVVDAAVSRAGAVLVDVRALVESLKLLGGERVALEEVGVNLRFSAGTSAFELPAGDAADYPPEALDKDAKSLGNVDREALLRLIDGVAHAVSGDETRPHFNSMLLEWGGGRRRAVATDGHRLAKREDAVAVEPPGRLLLPLRAVEEVRQALARDLPKDVSSVEVRASATTAWFSTPSWRYSVRLTDALFPSYDQVIPKEHVSAVRASRKDLAAALKTAVLFSSAKDEKKQKVHTGVRAGGVTLALSGSNLVVRSVTWDGLGAATATVAVRATGAAMLTPVGVNGVYLLDALSPLTGDDIELRFRAHERRAGGGEVYLAPITVADPADPDYLALVMPTRV